MALDIEPAAERDARVGDFLDDKLQTAADLQQLNALLASVRAQHELLQRQLVDAEQDLKTAKSTYQSHSAAVQSRGEQFAKEQDDIDRRLGLITQSSTSEDAVTQFEASMDKLRRLDMTAGYVEMLRDVDNLREECISSLGTNDSKALDAYRRIRNLHTTLETLQQVAEGAAPHLLDHVAGVATMLHEKIRAAFGQQVESILKKIYWPREEAAIPPGLQDAWADAAGKLLELQRPELEAAESALVRRERHISEAEGGRRAIVLLPMQILVHPLELKFRYHFEGDRPTNRLDRPEYFLQFLTDNILGAYNGFMMDHVQPLLRAHFKGTDLSMNPVYIDATSAFITAVLPMVRSKVAAQMRNAASQPQLLSHTVHEIMKFDAVIRDEWGYTGGPGSEGWRGMAWEALVADDWFTRWLQVEMDFAMARYQTIIEDASAGELDFESFDPGQTKPTKAAIRVNDLLETITDRYRNLPSFSQKLNFLIKIQIEIFDRFHQRLHSSLEAYVVATSRIGRTVQGISREKQQELYGVQGLDSLCRVFGSAEFLEKAMRDWSDDVFFLDLYVELQDRVQHGHKRDSSKGFAGDLSVAQVAERTSTAVVSEGGAADNGALFDETAAAYSRLRARSEGIITDVLQHNTKETLRAYQNINPWASLVPSSSVNSPSSPMPELSGLLEYLSTSLTFLRRALGTVPLRRITRSLLSAVDETLFAQVILRRSFSTQGSAQLGVDVGAIVGVVERSLGTSKGVDSLVQAGLGRVLEAVRLLNLPVRGSEETEEVRAQGVTGEEQDNSTRTELGLWQVEKRMFADNESARGVLEELGMERLGESEARSVLERRVELGG